MLIDRNSISININLSNMSYIHVETKPFAELNSNELDRINNCARVALKSDCPENQLKLGAMLLCQKGIY